MPHTKGGSSPYEREDEADRPRYWARTHEIGFKLGDRAYGIRPIRAVKVVIQSRRGPAGRRVHGLQRVWPRGECSSKIREAEGNAERHWLPVGKKPYNDPFR
jgi:hypothetical protein